MRSELLPILQSLVARGELKFSLHGYEELAADDILAEDVASGIFDAVVVEDYPAFAKGPALLALQMDRSGSPLHVVWGVATGQVGPAVMITAYRPSPARWLGDWKTRRPK